MTTTLGILGLLLLILLGALTRSHAYSANELFSSVTKAPFGRIRPRYVTPKTFAATAAIATYTAGTPVAYNSSTNKWVVWTNGGANGTGTIRGFVYPDSVTTTATGGANQEVLGQVMTEGEIDYADIVLPAGETANNLKAELQANSRDFGLHITGLDQVR